MKNLKYLLIAVIITLVAVNCSKPGPEPTPEPVHEEEVITTLMARLTSVSGSRIDLITKDADGDGPNKPVITISGDSFTASTTYNGYMTLLNELENPAEDITEEIEEEKDEHQFFFTVTNEVVSVAYADMDSNQQPVGLSFTLTTTTAKTGKLTITLRHEPNKSATGVAGGDITNAGGETDIETTFDITVE